MEVSCPKCSQRLRYSDALVNPLLRCRNCLTTFRPGESHATDEQPVSAVAVDEYDRDTDDQFRRFATEAPQQPASESSSAGGLSKRGLGTFGIIALVIAFKAGPRLMRELFREPRPDRPVQMRNEDQQAIERMLQEAAENGVVRRNAVPLPMPEPPARIVPGEP